MGDRSLGKWAPGPAYGPVLSQTDLYLLNTVLEINPNLDAKDDKQPLQFHLVTGAPVSNSPRPVDVPGKDEPATLPRVSTLILISAISPWCTIIKREHGVTVGDVCSTLFKEYSEQDITDAEFQSVNGRLQESIKRSAASHVAERQPTTWAGFYTPHVPDRLKRLDWLRERVYFEGIFKDDGYARSRLGFSAPNIFVMEIAQ